MKKSVAIIALGANLGDRETCLLEALHRLELKGIHVLSCSRFVETVPVGYTNQPDFLNGAAALEIPESMNPERLLSLLLTTEKELGRERPFPNAPRTCDLDLIFFEAEIRNTATLTLPHPRWQERAFVLVPLANLFEIANSENADWIRREPWGTLQSRVTELLKPLDCSEIRRKPEK